MNFSLDWRVLSLGLLLSAGAGSVSAAVDRPAAASVAQVAPASQRPGHAAIASANFLATRAGLEVLRKGGNAFDAAIAVASTLSVVEPESSGIGGGFMAVLHRAKDGHNVFIDARETAPAAVDPKDYVKPDGSPDRETSLTGPLSAGIPGEPAGLVLIAKRYGRLSLQQSLAPAIRIARDGFQPDPRLHGAIVEEQKVLQRWPASAAKYLVNGQPPAAGATWRDPDQARTLELIAQQGDAGLVQLGGFKLGRALVHALPGSDVVKPDAAALPYNLAASFSPHQDYLVTSAQPGSPRLGDLRVSWIEVPLQEVTVVARLNGARLDAASDAGDGKGYQVQVGDVPLLDMFPDLPVPPKFVMIWRVLGVLLAALGAFLLLPAQRRRQRLLLAMGLGATGVGSVASVVWLSGGNGTVLGGWLAVTLAGVALSAWCLRHRPGPAHRH
jgi:hypothetical protein